jgi:hypothetical protein
MAKLLERIAASAARAMQCNAQLSELALVPHSDAVIHLCPLPRQAAQTMELAR